MVLSDATLARLFEEQRARLLGHAWQLTGSAADAEDAVQEAFLRALRSRDGYEERGLGGPWLLRILVNVVRERARRQRFYRGPVHAELEAAAAGGVDPSASPERRAAAREGLSRALRALRQATPEQREVLVLRHFEERSTAEVAGLLGVPEATVRSRLKRARDLVLRACESDEGDER
jgi:RNA polymerase sigma-70 factor (ECF subfamily)